MKLWAISDLHVRHPDNRRAMEELEAHPDDWLILGGDICETADDLAEVLDRLGPRYRQLIWVPGNHELWTMPQRETARGVAKYDALVRVCRSRGVLTPEEEYPVFESEEGPHRVAPLFLLYDYSFAPEGMTPPEAKRWAKEAGLECVDERLLHPDPYPSREAWCAARCEMTEARLVEAAAEDELPFVLINHFPLLREHAVLPRVPRFKIWCGTTRTADWHRRFRAKVVVYGHLHIRRCRQQDGVRFEEVSLGYPRQWQRYHEPGTTMLRPIL